ncbi:MAG TPA: hypothetical protein VMB34_01095 [Acetobacteraceae bacterium]|nr:hypothetical protein [Acetobacteraceae bacterium]
MSSSNESPDQPGFALLVVLWTLAFLALVLTGLLSVGRDAIQVAGNIRDRAVEAAAADGGVQRAIFELRRRVWRSGGPPHRIFVGQTAVVIVIDDENGRIHPNYSSSALLTALLGTVARLRRKRRPCRMR